MNGMRPSLAVVVVVLGSIASAAPLRRGTAAIGSAKEDDVCPAPVAPRLAGPDVALIRALTWAFEPAPVEVRAQAIEDLGLLGDPRALDALASLTTGHHPELERAAIRAVGSIRHPRAEEILSELVRQTSVSMTSRTQALALLPFQNTPTAWNVVRRLSEQGTAANELLQLARNLNALLPPRPPSVPNHTARPLSPVQGSTP